MTCGKWNDGCVFIVCFLIVWNRCWFLHEIHKTLCYQSLQHIIVPKWNTLVNIGKNDFWIGLVILVFICWLLSFLLWDRFLFTILLYMVSFCCFTNLEEIEEEKSSSHMLITLFLDIFQLKLLEIPPLPSELEKI